MSQLIAPEPRAPLTKGPPSYDVLREVITGAIALLVVVGDLYAHIFNHVESISVVDAVLTLVVGFYFGRGVATTTGGQSQ